MKRTLIAASIILGFAGILFLVTPALVNLDPECQKCEAAKSQVSELARDIAILTEIDALQSPLDPWGRRYNIATVSLDEKVCILVWTFGADGVEGGESKHNIDIIRIARCD